MSGGAFTSGVRRTNSTAWALSRRCGGGLNLSYKVAAGRWLKFLCLGLTGLLWLLPSGTGVSPSSLYVRWETQGLGLQSINDYKAKNIIFHNVMSGYGQGNI